MYNLTIFGELTSRGSWIVAEGSCSRLTGHFGVHSWSCTTVQLYNLMHGWEGLFLGPSEAGSISVAQTEVGESAIQLCACLLQTALLSLGLHWGFTVSYLDSNTLTKALLSMDGC